MDTAGRCGGAWWGCSVRWTDTEAGEGPSVLLLTGIVLLDISEGTVTFSSSLGGARAAGDDDGNACGFVGELVVLAVS